MKRNNRSTYDVTDVVNASIENVLRYGTAKFWQNVR